MNLKIIMKLNYGFGVIFYPRFYTFGFDFGNIILTMVGFRNRLDACTICVKIFFQKKTFKNNFYSSLGFSLPKITLPLPPFNPVVIDVLGLCVTDVRAITV